MSTRTEAQFHHMENLISETNVAWDTGQSNKHEVCQVKSVKLSVNEILFIYTGYITIFLVPAGA